MLRLEGVGWLVLMASTYFGVLESCSAARASVEYRILIQGQKRMFDLAAKYPIANVIVIEARTHSPSIEKSSLTLNTAYPKALLETLCNDLEDGVCIIPTAKATGEVLEFQRLAADYLLEVQRIQNQQSTDVAGGSDEWIAEESLWPKQGLKTSYGSNVAYVLDALRLRLLRPDIFTPRYTLPMIMRPKTVGCESKAAGFMILAGCLFVMKLVVAWYW